MKFKPTWSKVIMKDDLFEFKRGKKVLVTPFNFKHKSVAPTWFLFDGVHSYQVAESYGGRNLSQLVSDAGGVYSDQSAVNAKFRPVFEIWLKSRKKPPKTPKNDVFLTKNLKNSPKLLVLTPFFGL